MKKQIIVAAAVLAVAALSGCAPSQMTALIDGSSNHDQTPATVIPGRVMTVSPVSRIAVGFFAAKTPGEDVIVRPFSPPRNLISVVQPTPASGPLKSDEIVGVITRDGQTRVIPLPNFAPQGSSSSPIVIHWPKQK